MSSRSPFLLVLTLAVAGLTACTNDVPTPVTPVPAVPAAPSAPDPTQVPTPTLVPEPTATPIIGGVDGNGRGPELTIVPVDATTITVGIEDPVAKAWQIEVRGTGSRARDAWKITVEVGDVGPLITASEIVDGAVIDELDLSGIWDGTAVAGGCHSTLPICLDSDSFRLPDNGDGTFSVRLQLDDAAAALEVQGAAAYWDGEPFILSPWYVTETFPWGPAAG
jgi:hypothetical protein